MVAGTVTNRPLRFTKNTKKSGREWFQTIPIDLPGCTNPSISRNPDLCSWEGLNPTPTYIRLAT